MPRLPLFPLGTVLFPGAHLPLRIFEPRYVEMLHTLASGPQPGRFGVVAIRAGHEVGTNGAHSLHSVGCVAALQHVDHQPDGSYAVNAIGTQRFALRGVVDERDGPSYHVGSVEWLDEPIADPIRVDQLARLVRRRLVDYKHVLGDQTPLEERAADNPTVLSYRVGELVALSLSDRQSLLACRSTDERLQRAAALLRRECTLVSTLQAVPGQVQAPPFSAN